MRMTSCVVWEVEREEIEKLPLGFEVFEVHTLSEKSQVKQAGVDNFRYGAHIRHYLMKMPPLPVNNLAAQAVKAD